MNFRKTLLSGILASSMAMGGTAAFAQDSTPVSDTPDATPVATPTSLEGVPVFDVDGNAVAQVDVWEDENGEGVWLSVSSTGDTGLEEGKYGIHVHETGVCDAEGDEPFSTAGGHFNPTNEAHGDLNADPSHAGDLGNLEADADGNFEHEVLSEKLALNPGSANSLADEDGSALIIHDGEDDLETDPSGDSGNRWACAVLVPPTDGVGTPASSPVTTPEATPVS